MRIVGGTARGRRLAAPADGTRPTSDRTREALFNTLDALVVLPGAHVLDLYAGTGAVGLEALSRGAARVTFVESDRAAAAVLALNRDAVDLPGVAIARTTVRRFLAGTADDGPYDLVFADPPYALPEDELADMLELVEPALVAGGVVVVERASRSPEPRWPKELTPMKLRRYGEGTLWYGLRR